MKPTRLPRNEGGNAVAAERIYRKTERTPEEMARIRAIRERFQRERPTLEELVASGECDPPVPQGAYRELRVLMHALKKERERLGLSLADIADETELDEEALRLLETGMQINPTVDTLWRYGYAVGKHLSWSLADEPATKPVEKPKAGAPRRPKKKPPAKRKAATNHKAQPAAKSVKKGPRK